MESCYSLLHFHVDIDRKKLATFPPDSEYQQAEVVAIKDEDGYNWG